MRGFGERKNWIVYTILAITIVIGFVCASGCADVFFGSQKLGDFGSSVNEQQAVNCFIGKYGDPQTNAGPARFLEPMITTGLVNNTPVDTVMKLNKDTPKVTFLVFYDNFAKGDDLELKWTYLVSGKDVMTLHQQAGGDFGRAFAEFLKPDSGWPTGQHKISISGKGATAYVTIDVIDGATVTGTLPCQDGGQAQDGQKFKPGAGGTLRVIITAPTVVGAVGPKPQNQEGTATEEVTATEYRITTITESREDSEGRCECQENLMHPSSECDDIDGTVWLILLNDKGQESEQINLDNNENNFERGKTDYFTYYGPDLGDLKKARFRTCQVTEWGGTCYWHCYLILRTLIVKNMRTNQEWIFPGTIITDQGGCYSDETYCPSGNNTLTGYLLTQTSPPPTSPAPVAPTTTPPIMVQLHTTPTIVYACWTQPKILTHTLYPSTPPTTSPTTVPTTPKVVYLNTTPTTPIPRYKGSSI